MNTLIRFLTSWMQRNQHRRPSDACGHTCQACQRKNYQKLAQNICTALRMAAEPVTPENIMAFAASLPLSDHDINCPEWRAKYCNRCLHKAFENTPETERDGLYFNLLRYFAHDFVNSSDSYKQDLINAILGLLDGLSLDSPLGLYQRLTQEQEHPPNN